MKKKNLNTWYSLSLVTELGLIIAVPVSILAYLGAKIDKMWHTSPLFLMIGIFFSLIISGFLVYTKVKKINS